MPFGVEDFSNFQIAVNVAPVPDTKQVNIRLVKRENHPVIAHDRKRDKCRESRSSA
jgi:hypothetical protein